jgi:hypothetical protein
MSAAVLRLRRTAACVRPELTRRAPPQDGGHRARRGVVDQSEAIGDRRCARHIADRLSEVMGVLRLAGTVHCVVCMAYWILIARSQAA